MLQPADTRARREDAGMAGDGRERAAFGARAAYHGVRAGGVDAEDEMPPLIDTRRRVRAASPPPFHTLLARYGRSGGVHTKMVLMATPYSFDEDDMR